MKLVLLSAMFVSAYGSNNKTDSYIYNFAREREVTKHIILERLHVVERQSKEIADCMASDYCPSYIKAEQAKIAQDKKTLQYTLIKLND